MAFDFSQILKVIPEATVSTFIDNMVDAELAKVSDELKRLVKEALDKAYGTSIAAAATKPLSTSAQV